jgi:hypothetical protein
MEAAMHSIIRAFLHPLKVAFMVLTAAALCGWFAVDPRAALRFWPGVLIGVLAATVGRF